MNKTLKKELEKKMINGILIVNKDKDITSRKMVNNISHFLDCKKVGHTGTLDPMATGILVVLLGRYTKLCDELSFLEKEYIFKIKIGIKTDTLDITGNVIEEKECVYQKEDLIRILDSLIGKYEQTIPLYSAKKINGKKLYEYAREGKSIELPTNIVEIYNLELLDSNDDEITVKAYVSKGTYIRSIIQSICDKLGIIGTMSSLVRTKQGSININESYSMEDIKEGNYKILNARDLLNYDVYNLTDEEYKKVLNGNKINIDIDSDKVILIYNEEEIAIYKKENNLYSSCIMLNINN